MDAHNERLEYSEYREELMTGIIASTMANWSMHPPKKALSPSDFMPSRESAEKPVRARRTNTKQVVSDIRAWVDQMRAAGKVITTNPKTAG
jgi:hypothetical protein